jgi:hypothetical protein
MLTKTNYTISATILQEARTKMPPIDSRLLLNQPIGSFFNDPWEIKPEFKGTVWEEILDSLACDKGEARLIKLTPGEAYSSHADIDDRWHLSIVGNHSYLIDLETNTMHKTIIDGNWYSMNAGIRHTAANFGSEDRIQLVVRQLLPMPHIDNPAHISITLKTIVEDRRFIFDDVLSPWLNRAYKKGIVDNFNGKDLVATFTVEECYVPELQELVSEHFNLKIL